MPRVEISDRKMLRALLDVTGKINSGLVIEEILEHIYDSFHEIIPYDRIGCALVDQGDMKIRAIWAKSTSQSLELAPGYSASLEATSLAHILETGEPRILNDLESYLRENPASDSTRRIVKEGHRSSLTCPLIVEGKPVGFLFFSSRDPGAYAEAHVEAYLEIAFHVSVIVEKGRFHQELLETQRDLEEANRRLEELANHDALTGLPNRRHFDLLFAREWSRAIRYCEPLSAIAVDVDYFKQYNDIYGHLAGDICLRRIAETLAHNTQRGTDLVARVGGEEFIILLPATARAGAARMAERMRRLVKELQIEHLGSAVESHVTISLGVAGSVLGRGMPAEDLLGAADSALYRAKESGRNCVSTEQEYPSEPQKNSGQQRAVDRGPDVDRRRATSGGGAGTSGDRPPRLRRGE